MDSGAEEQAISHADWRHLDEPSLRPAQVRLRSAAGNDMGVIVSISVHGGCDAKLVVLSPLFTTATTKSLSSASKILSLGSVVEMKPTILFCTKETTAVCYFKEVANVIFR